MFDTVGGLPVHALVIHAVVVLLPLSALGAILITVRPRLMRLFGVASIIGAGVGTAAAFIAKFSGEALASRVGVPEPHADYGDKFPLIALLYFILLVVFWLFARGVPLNRNRPLWLKGFGVVVILAALGMTYFTFITGHSGAEASWAAIIENTRPDAFVVDD